MLTVRQQSIFRIYLYLPAPLSADGERDMPGRRLKSIQPFIDTHKKLEQMDYIERRPNSSRCITLKVLNN